MSIRRLLITLLALLGLLILLGSLWQVSDIRTRLRAISWIEQSNGLADASLHASAVMAMERGITAAILADTLQANGGMQREMLTQRRALDEHYQRLLDIAHALPTLPANHPLVAALRDLASSRQTLESFRHEIDLALEQGGEGQREQAWFTLSSSHIEALMTLRFATMAPLPDNPYSYVSNPVLKQVLFTISENAGRERAIVGIAIAQNRPLTAEELERLRQYRNLVRLRLKTSESITRYMPTTAELTHATTRLSTVFLGRYEELRQAVLSASREGRPYPVSAEEWYTGATAGINTVLELADVLNDQLRQDIGRLRGSVELGSTLVLFSMLGALLVFTVALTQIRRRILEPLQRLEGAANTIAGGDLQQPLPAFNQDELGHLATAFDHMRQTLLDDIQQREAAAAELRKFALSLEQSADAVMITDRDRNIEYVNAAFERTRGYHRSEVLGKNAAICKQEINDPTACENFQQALEQGEAFCTTLANQRADGTPFYEEVTLSPLRDPAGVITHYISTSKDVTVRIRAEAELRKLSQAIEQSVSSVIITDPEGIIEYVNPQFSRTTGYHAEEVRGRKLNMLKSGQTTAAQYQELWHTIKQGQVWEGELLNKRKNGELYWELVSISPVRNPQGLITNFVGLQHDISEHKKLEEQLNFFAFYDELTQLPNRNLLTQRFKQAAGASRRNGTLLALLSLDICRFKLINDSLGHRIGDEVLRTIGTRLSQAAREHDTVARYGGDEFVVILSDVENPDDISTVAQRMLDAAAQPMVLEGHELRLALHIGISLMPQDGDDLDTLLRNAITALHQAAREGRNHFRFYTEELNAAASARLSMEHALRRALEQNELELHYQPKVDLQSGRITGVEALARWHHPTEGWIPPVQFIPVAEETGLIMELGEWALREACTQNRRWQAAGLPPITVAVNLSVCQLRQPTLVATVTRILGESELEARYLELELTESAVMESPDETVRILGQLKALGLSLAVDDFGTGYSSLSHLGHFAFDTLKIDRSFVIDITSAPDQATIAKTIIAMADSLRLKVVAEGVEGEEQAVYLRDKGCDELQGYLFSRPLPAAELETLLRSGRALTLPPRRGEKPEAFPGNT
ncbi:MAG: EAL domain-containing protein [Gammaproteobacteria bacterium]|nr:EAL domain-containing protein [Gammaproteobacteria bacterium]